MFKLCHECNEQSLLICGSTTGEDPRLPSHAILCDCAGSYGEAFESFIMTPAWRQIDLSYQKPVLSFLMNPLEDKAFCRNTFAEVSE